MPRESKKARIARMHQEYEQLCVEIPDPKCALNFNSPFELLVATVLSAQTTDKRVNMVTPSLYQKFPTLEAFANATYEEVGDAIRSCGFYNTKSKDIVECAKILLEKYGGKVTWDELGLPVTETGLALPCGATGRWFSE